MKIPLRLLALLPLAALAQPSSPDRARVAADFAPDGGHLVVEARGVPPKAPVFFSAAAENAVRLGATAIEAEIHLHLRIVQGRPEVLSVGLSGEGDIVDVRGEGLKDWAVRQAEGRRFLDLRPVLAEGNPGPAELDLTIHAKRERPEIPGASAILLLNPGDAIGFASRITLAPGDDVDLRVMKADGLTPLGSGSEPHAVQNLASTGAGALEVMLVPRGGALAEAELVGVQLAGKFDPAAGGVNFQLRAEARAARAGARLPLLSGRAALDGVASGDGWHVELKNRAAELVLDRAGNFPIALDFIASVREAGGWRRLEFNMPAGAVVPIRLDGLPGGIVFDPVAPVMLDDSSRRGSLPADGRAVLAWKQNAPAGEGASFFTSHEQADVRVGAGLLRQSSRLDFRVLQGRLAGVRIRLDGPGEILAVEGANVLGWKVAAAGKQRTLDVQLSRPFEKDGSLLVRSQAPLGNFPVRAEPLRLTPEGGVRHSGIVRVANDGAVRLEIVDATGLLQLSPEQFPGDGAEPGVRQVFVYRFPSASYAYWVVASQILPEVAVSQVVIYELGDSDRVLTADLELDIREAPLREWSLAIPEDYAVVTIGGGAVADYAAETEARGGSRTLKILFDGAVQGRQLDHLRLEKNQAAAAGVWRLPPLAFPGAKSVRGHVGIVSAPGFRVVPAEIKNLVEMPLSYFPQQAAGLVQAYRLRDPGWAAALKIEALGQSVEADVFHLYSLKEGIVLGSVLINYFVVGAPANEWRIEVPASAGNIDVVGQNVQRDWRREGNQVIVTLHQPVLGAATLLVTFEQPMSARGGVIRPGEVRPLGVQGERGFVQVVSPLQVKSEILKAGGNLLKLEPLELPAEFRLLTSSPSLAAYQYTSRPFALEMNVDWYAPAETVDQLVDFAKLSSRVSRDGQVVTDARYFVKTRGRKALRLTLPEGAKLWEARAGGELVNARADGDQTLVPLPPRANPNEPVEVVLRLGQTSKRPRAPELNAPRAQAPTVLGEWTISGDPGQLLVPKGGTAQLAAPNLTETGFEWLSTRAPVAALFLLTLAGLAAVLLRARGGWKPVAGFLVAAVAVLGALELATAATTQRRVNAENLTYAATVVPAGETATIQIANVPAAQAMLSWWGVFAAMVGVALIAPGALRASSGGGRAGWAGPAGAALLGAGILAQRGGAIVFFLLFAVAGFFVLLLPTFLRWWRRPRPILQPPAASVLLLALGFGMAPALRAQESRAAESIVQSWRIQDGRLFGEVELRGRGAAGDSFLLLRPPAVLTDFQGDGLRAAKVDRAGRTIYMVALEKNGAFTAHAKFEAPVEGFRDAIPLLTGPAAVQRVTVDLDQGGWAFASPAAVSVRPLPGLPKNHSGAALVLGPEGEAVIRIQAKTRDAAAEKAKFYAEAANLFIPAPGVVNGIARVTIRPVQGQVSALELVMPKGFTVGDVTNGPVAEWRFDPQSRKLRVVVEPAQDAVFKFDVESQLGTGELPVDLALEPVRVAGAAGEVGMLGLAFGGDAQPENVRGLSPINLEDFDAGLLPRSRDGGPAANLQQVFRYGGGGGRVTLRVAPVAPEIRVATKQIFSFGDDRLVLAADLHAAITRAGIFKLSFSLPKGLEVEAISGSALNNWTEASENGQRVIVLQLNGRTIGDQDFSMTLTGPAPAAQKAWLVPRVSLREATRQTGEIFLVPDKGLRLRAVERENVSQLDPAELGDNRPGTLAFRLLQQDWSLRVGIEALDPWITAQALQEITVREGQTLTRLAVRYRVDNAAVKKLRIRLPGLSASQAQTVRASGPAVSDLVKVPGESDVWELHFQRGIAGETDVQIQYQGQTAREQGRESVQPPVFDGARQVAQFVSLRGSGRIELDARALPRGWQRVDWGGVPAHLQDRSDRSVPVLCFRVAEPEAPLAVEIRRHDVADALKLRVTEGALTTLFSPRGPSLTAVQLTVEVVEKSSLRVEFPKGAQLFSAFVNEESIPVVREGDACLLTVSPKTDADRSASVRLVYSVPGLQRGAIDLTGPSLNVPLVNVSWRVLVPAGYEVRNYRGGLTLKKADSAGLFGLQEYTSRSSSARTIQAKKAADLMEEANTLLRNGEQQQAGEVLSRVANGFALDEASNEDARVQLKTLKTQQAILGLNTRRQRLYLDNKSTDVAHNAQLEQAASQNPFMQGRTNFDPQQIDQLLMGNSAEENTALRGIAARIVEQQLAAEPAAGAIDVTIPESGRVLTFTRSIQVDGAAPLSLELGLGKLGGASVWFSLALLLATAAVGGMAFPRRAVS